MTIPLPTGPITENSSSIDRLLIYHDLIEGIVEAIEARDTYTADHSVRVAVMTEAICGFLNLNQDDTVLYHISAHVHDLGKIGIEDAILCKLGPLDDEEWEQMKSHPVIGFTILNKIESFEEVSKIVRAHHERWDGKGYPDGLSSTDIPYGARIIAIADSIDAMLSVRPYREGLDLEVCRKEVLKNKGKMFDPDIVDTVLNNFDELIKIRKEELYIGSDEVCCG